MEQLIGAINQGRAPTIEDPGQLSQIKQEFSSFIANAEEQVTTQAREAQSNRRTSLLKSAVIKSLMKLYIASSIKLKLFA